MERGVPVEMLDEALPVLKMLPEGNDFLTVRSIKNQIDGSLGAHGAWLLAPYHELPGTDGLVLETVEDIEATAEVAVRRRPDGIDVTTVARPFRDRRDRDEQHRRPGRAYRPDRVLLFVPVADDAERRALFYPKHVMTRKEALRTYAIDNAYAAFDEHLKGALTSGKYADVVVLSENLLTVAEELIPETQVEMTFVGGELKYQKDEALASR